MPAHTYSGRVFRIDPPALDCARRGAESSRPLVFVHTVYLAPALPRMHISGIQDGRLHFPPRCDARPSFFCVFSMLWHPVDIQSDG